MYEKMILVSMSQDIVIYLFIYFAREQRGYNTKNYLYLKSIRKLVEKGKIDITTSPFPDWVQALQ